LSISNATMTIPGYRLEERCDRTDTTNGIGGGLAIYIKEKYVTFPFSKNRNFNQFVGFKIKTKAQPLTIILVYRPPSSSNENTTELCKLLTGLDKNTLVIGDFNLPGIIWEDGTADTKGRDVLATATEEGLEQMVDFSTHIKGNRLDLVLSNCPEKVVSITDEGRLGRSDHVMILLKVETCAKQKAAKSSIVCWSKGNYKKIREKLSSVRWREQMDSKQTDAAWAFFKNQIEQLVEDNIPTFIPTGKFRPKWLTSEIRKLLSQKKKAWKKAKADQLASSRSEYEEIAKALKKKIAASKKKLERNLAENKQGNGKQFRNYIKQRTRSRDPVGPLIQEDGTSLTEEAEIAEALNKFFAGLFTKEDKTNLPVKEPETNQKLEKIIVTRSEVIRKIRKLRPESAAGPDNIHPKLLIECAQELAEPLTIIFRKSMRESCVPSDWKKAIVTPIFKKRQTDRSRQLSPSKLNQCPLQNIRINSKGQCNATPARTQPPER
jgi:Endonuclease-reverse transcriptase